MSARADVSPVEVLVATAVAVLMEASTFLMLRTHGGSGVHADISDDRAKPMSVSITPIVDEETPVLKLGTKKQPGKLPDRWLAPRPVERAVPHAVPSPKAEAIPHAIPTASVLNRPVPSASPSAQLAKEIDTPLTGQAPSGPEPVSTVEGSPDGVKNGTETDPLKAHAVSLYRVKLDGWFSARFAIRGKLPFDTLKNLKARVVVEVTAERTVGGFTIASPSGNPTFDEVVRSTLQSIQSSQAELPPPPPLYPDILGQTLPIVFSCTTRSRCE